MWNQNNVEQQAIKPLAMVPGCKWPPFVSAFIDDETLRMPHLEVYSALSGYHFHWAFAVICAASGRLVSAGRTDCFAKRVIFLQSN